MPRKSRIIRAVKPGGTARRDNDRARLDGVKSIVLYPETERAVNPVVVNGKIENVHVVQHLNVRRLRDCRSQNRLDVLAVDFDVTVPAGHILAVLVLQRLPLIVGSVQHLNAVLAESVPLRHRPVPADLRWWTQLDAPVWFFRLMLGCG